MSVTQFTQKFMENLVAKNPAEPEFHQAVREVVESLVPCLERNPQYLEHKILERSPFETIDVPGVGSMVRAAAAGGRVANPELRLGICGEHGGDPESIGKCEQLGLDYVSCSPFRVPVARLAAAQAALANRVGAPPTRLLRSLRIIRAAAQRSP